MFAFIYALLSFSTFITLQLNQDIKNTPKLRYYPFTYFLYKRFVKKTFLKLGTHF